MEQQYIEEILTRLSEGETLRPICKSIGVQGVTKSAFLNLVDRSAPLRDRYTRARAEGIDVLADDLLGIADGAKEDPNSRRVRVDTRKWLLSKLKPEVYGDMLQPLAVNVMVAVPHQAVQVQSPEPIQASVASDERRALAGPVIDIVALPEGKK